MKHQCYSKTRLLGAFLILALLVTGFPIRPVHAVTLTLTNTNDSGTGSLRQFHYCGRGKRKI